MPATAELLAVLKAENSGGQAFKGFASDFEETISKIAGRKIEIDPVVLAKGAGVAAIAGLAVELGRAAEEIGSAFDESFDAIVVRTGAAGDALEGLQNDFRQVVSDVPADFNAAARAIGELNQRLDLTGTALQEVAGQQLELSRLTGTDLGENIRSTSRLFQQFGLDAGEASEALDKLFVAQQASGATVGQLAQGLTTAGAAVRGLGLSMDQGTALLAAFEKQGVNSELSARALRTALANLTKAGLDAPTAFQEFIAAIRDTDDEAAALTLSLQLFGERAGTELADAIRRGAFNLDVMTEKLANAKGSIKDTAAATADAAEAWKTASNQMAVALEPIGTALFGLRTSVVGTMAGVVRAFTDNGQTIRREADAIAEAARKAELAQSGGLGEGEAGPRFGVTTAPPPRPKTTLTTEEEEALSKVVSHLGQDFREKMGKTTRDALTQSAVSALGAFEGEFGAIVRRLNLEAELGSEGARAAEAFLAAFGPDWSKNAASSVEALLSAMQREGVPGATELGQDIHDAIALALLEPYSEGLAQNVLDAIAKANQALAAKRDEPRQQADAERNAAQAKRDAEEAAREAERRAREALDVPIVGFMKELSNNRANLNDQFGEVGAGAAIALTQAFIEQNASSGSAVAREVENIVDRLRKENVPEWRALGDDLAGAFHDALILGTEEAKQAALSKLDEVAAALKANKALSPENFATAFDAASLRAQLGSSGASVMDALTQTFEEGGEKNREALARSAVSWIQEIRKGLPPDEASAAVDDLMDALRAAAEGRQDDAREALEGLFSKITLRIPTAAIDKAFDDAVTRINENRDKAIQDTLASNARGEDLNRRRNAFGEFQQLQTLQLQLQQAAPDVDPNSLSRGLNERSAQVRILSEQANAALRREREDADRALALLREQEDRRDAQSNRPGIGIRVDDLAKLSQVEKDAAIRRINDQQDAARRQASSEEDALRKRHERDQQDFNTRREREQQDAATRFANDLALAQLQDQQALQRAAFERQIAEEELSFRTGAIEERARIERETAEQTHTEAMTKLEQERTILGELAGLADTTFDGMLEDVTNIVEQSGTLAAALGNLPRIGIGGATLPVGAAGADTGKTVNNNIALNVNAPINQVTPQEVASAMVTQALNFVASA